MALGLGRWFQRFRWFQKFRIFESGFCPFCVRFLPSAPTNERTHVVQNAFWPYAVSARIWILAFRIWYSNCKSQYLDKTFCKVQLIAKSNLLQNPTYSTLFIVKGTNQILRCITHCCSPCRPLILD